MTTIVHRTPGLLDLVAVETVGLSAKPGTDHPIGKFGTGLKYAIAVIVRLGGEIDIWVGQERVRFTAHDFDFRGVAHQRMRMHIEGHTIFNLPTSRVRELPFTTDYGKFWEAWMAYRELRSNTIDEGGDTWETDHEHAWGIPGQTTIVVRLPAYAEAHASADQHFLPGAATVRSGSERIQVIDGKSSHVYFRGLRVMDLEKPSAFTYNILQDIELTEDRTVRNPWQVRSILASHLLESDDERMIERIVTVKKEEGWEFNTEFPSWATPSPAFRKVMERHPKSAWPSAMGYYGRHDTRPVAVRSWRQVHPTPWQRSSTTIVDANGNVVLDCPIGYKGRWETFVDNFLRETGFAETPARPELPDQGIEIAFGLRPDPWANPPPSALREMAAAINEIPF